MKRNSISGLLCAAALVIRSIVVSQKTLMDVAFKCRCTFIYNRLRGRNFDEGCKLFGGDSNCPWKKVFAEISAILLLNMPPEKHLMFTTD